MNKIVKGASVVLNAIALLLVMKSVNSACLFWFHQPEMPEDAGKYKMK